jgi:hypothetical protein
MGANDLEAIGKRFTRLEREIRVWKSGATATTVLLLALVLCGVIPKLRSASAADSSATDLVVRSLRVVDEQGITRAHVFAGKDGSQLVLYDKKGAWRVILGVSQDGPGLALYDQNGVAGAVLGALKDGPGLLLSDESGAQRARLLVNREGPHLGLYDEKGAPRAVVGFSAKHGSGLVLYNERGMQAAALAANVKEPGAVLYDAKGSPRAILSVLKNEPRLVLFDENGARSTEFGRARLDEIRVGTSERTEPSSIRVFDKDGKIIWRAP